MTASMPPVLLPEPVAPVTPEPAARYLLQYIDQHLRAGAVLPSRKSLCDVTRLNSVEVSTALHQLNNMGVICWRPRDPSGRRVLAPGQPHPDDAEVISVIRKRILDATYLPGAALPVGVLAYRHGLTIQQVVHRACRVLAVEGLVHLGDGPHGHGVYVTNNPIAALATNRTCADHAHTQSHSIALPVTPSSGHPSS